MLKIHNKTVGCLKLLKLRNIFFLLLTWLFLYASIEFCSYLLLRFILNKQITIDYFDQSNLLKLFPAQLRMKNIEIRKMFPRDTPFQKTGNYLSFPFEPALGFYTADSSEWYGEFKKNKTNYFIVTFGGSTTVKDNWPKYLSECAAERKVKENLVILNAGHWGYMSFNEKIYLTARILPLLESQGLTPNIILSLDGVNDVWSRIMGYLESKNEKSSEWMAHYHGYHQQLDTDMRNLSKLSNIGRQFISSLASNVYGIAVNYFSPIFPYTMKAILEGARRALQSNPVRSSDQHKENNKDNKLVSANIVIERPVQLEATTEKQLVTAYQDNLLDFFGEASVRGIGFIAYLQPVYLPKYYPHAAPASFDYPSFNYFGKNYYRENKHWSRFKENQVIATERIYEMAEKMYSSLNAKHPGHFSNIAYVLKDISETAEVFNKDAIHYQKKGKKSIACAIINDLLIKRHLH